MELTAEEREEVGGAEVIIEYAAPWGELAGELLLLVLMVWVLGGLVAAVEPAGPPWHTLDLRELVARPVLVLCGLLLAVGGARSSLILWRGTSGSPGLVAGPLGVRVHGTWPVASTHRWEDVRHIDVQVDRIVVTLQRPDDRGARILRALRDLAGAPLVVPMRPTAFEEVRAALARLGQAAA